MKITIYELLGMVKDGKAPKKIKYRDNLFEYSAGLEDYRADDVRKYHGNHLFHYLFEEVNFLNDEVEILDDEEKKIPEKLRIEQDTPSSNYYIRNENGTKCGLTKHSKMIVETLNSVIDYLDYLKSKGDE